MVECNICGAAESIPFHCNYCKNSFCNIHRNPVNHSCPFLNIYDTKRKKLLLNGGRRPASSRILRVKSSRTELLHLGIATLLVTAVGLSLNGYRYVSWQFLAIFVSAFLVHELAHKFLAQYYGSWAEFRAYMWGLVITAISALPIMPFKFIAPGAVMIGLSDRNKFGRVALIGPMTNLVMGFLFLLFAQFYPHYSYLYAGASFNAWIALFNLLPFGVLDGQKIFEWNKIIWGIVMATTMALFIVANF
jgi:Zn-dependent protease